MLVVPELDVLPNSSRNRDLEVLYSGLVATWELWDDMLGCLVGWLVIIAVDETGKADRRCSR